jgi:hypothetical protein
MVVGAREAVVGLLAEARLAAIESGSASVRITVGTASAEALAGGMSLRAAALGADFGVTVTLSGAATQVDLAYDGLGIGRMASQTITFRRGREVTQLIVSAYGRARRL